ncbi:hypothetical protein BMS3Bbin11_01717 [bacterium BMS3Bbin11]|nr:hypothetical protein BMS3Bbin11_01717 [bacterium BMS3Bbin11]
MEQSIRIIIRKTFNQRMDVALLDTAKHASDIFTEHFTRTKSDGLIQQTKPVPHTTVRTRRQ